MTDRRHAALKGIVNEGTKDAGLINRIVHNDVRARTVLLVLFHLKIENICLDVSLDAMRDLLASVILE